MRTTRRTHLFMLGSTAMALGLSGTSSAIAQGHSEPKTIEVQMLNAHPEDRGERMVFYPDLIQANPGDTIRFLPTDPGHNVASKRGMLPEGAEPWRSRIGDEFEITLEIEGAYGIECTPHSSAGMVGLILVGDASSNFGEVRDVRQRGRSANRYEDIFARAEALIANGSDA